MDHGNGSQSQPDVFPELLHQLHELLELQRKYQPNLTLPLEDNEDEVTIGIRNGSAHILRCLKVWYELPSDVLFASINIMDRFLTKMKVQQKHIACISVASFHIACKLICSKNLVPEPSDIIKISQCKCTPRDLARMETIITNKIGIDGQGRENIPVTTLSFLKLFDEMVRASQHSETYQKLLDPFQTLQNLEVIACDGVCSNFEPSKIALVLFCSMIDVGVARLTPAPPAVDNVIRLIEFVTGLQDHCHIADDNFNSCLPSVMKIMSQYNSQCGMPHRQRLVWRLSQRTMRYLRPTKLITTLPTIEEQGHLKADEE